MNVGTELTDDILTLLNSEDTHIRTKQKFECVVSRLDGKLPKNKVPVLDSNDFKISIDALDKQIPMEADIYVDIYNENIQSFCPRCHNDIDSYTRYCPSCGQRILFNYNKFMLNESRFEVDDSQFETNIKKIYEITEK